MKIIRIIKLAIKNILSNKLRTSLTALGLIIGISSVIVLVGIGKGTSSSVKSQVQSLGTDILTGSISSSEYSLDYKDMDDLLEISNVSEVAPYKNISVTVSRGTTTSNKSSVIATNNNYLGIINVNLNQGRRISIIDIENNSKVCILGSEITQTLFNLGSPVGETIKLNGDNYTVIGVLEEQGSSMGTDIDNIILIPITSAKHLDSDTSINNFYVKVENEDIIEKTSGMIESYLRQKLQISSDYYSVTSQDSMLDAMESIDNTLSLLLGGIASISLIVGGIGVMNVMLVSVTERTKEIGIRKSLGAKRRDILIQFLVEALVLSLLGGMLGIVIGLLIGNFVSNFGYTFETSSFIVMLSFGAVAVIGIIFGIFPAYRAAKLNPIDALRQE